jgi:hypothetical protein
VVGHHNHFVFSQELLVAQGCGRLFSFKKIAKHTCRHIEKIPEKLTRSTQGNVTWQTSSEYRRLIVPSGRTLTMSRLCGRFNFRKYLGPPSYTNPPYPLFRADIHKIIIEVFTQGQQQLFHYNHSHVPYT